MSQLTHPRAQVLDLRFRFRTWLAVAAAIAAVAIPTALVISGGDDQAQSLDSSAATSGLRYDGGPDEGTRGSSATASGIRYDGGPDEGSRGLISTQGATGSSSEHGDTFGARP
jgi:hypothetical protein